MAVPKLRFKEFNEQYTSYKLKDIVDFYKGNTLAKSDITENGNKKCILYGELYTKYSEIAYKIYSNTNNNSNNLFIGLKNDVLIPCSGETALDISTTTCLQEDNVIIGSDLNVLRPKGQDGKYLSYLLCNKKRKEIAKYAQGDSIVHLYGEKIKKIDVNIPSMKEQNLVSSLLSKLDMKIELQKQKIEALKLYKKGLLNSIYNNQLQNIDEIELKEFAYLQGGYAFKSELFTKNGIPIIRISNINDNNISLKDLVFYIENEHIDSKFRVTKGDILIAMSGATTGKIGVYKEISDSYINQRVGKIVLNNNLLIYPYLYFLFDISIYNSQLKSKLVAGAQPNISPSDIESLKFRIPNILIQEKIANIVISTNKLIETQEDKLKKLSILKKGLLNNMFI